LAALLRLKEVHQLGDPNMPVITRYSSVKAKDNQTGNHVSLTAVRVIGFALEKGLKQARDVGLGAFLAMGMLTMTLTGSYLEVMDDGSLQNRRSCTLQLAPEALQLLKHFGCLF
jgi:hypothetical protein